MPETQWMTLLETAEMMNRLPVQVTRMCEDGKLEYYKEDGRYFVSRESIDLFMRPATGGLSEADTDSNGTPRRSYGRAPEDNESSTEPASEPATVNGRDEPNAAGEAETVEIVAEAAGHGDAGADRADQATGHGNAEADRADQADQAGRDLEATPETGAAHVEAGTALGQDEEDAVAREEEASAENDAAAEDEPPAEDEAPAENDAVAEDEALAENDAAAEDEPMNKDTAAEDEAPAEDEQPAEDEAPAETLLRESADPVTASQDGEHAPTAAASDDPGAKAAEILADLRAALARHAQEHRAFCDEIAGLADALESTLTRGGDKTSELSREISSLLARYTRR